MTIVIEHPANRALEVTGSEREAWLNGMLTADLAGKSNSAIRSLCLDRLGKIHAEVLVWREPSRFVLVVTNGNREQLVEHLQRHIIMEDVELTLTDERLYSFHDPVENEAIRPCTAQANVSFATTSWLTPIDLVALVSGVQNAEFCRCLEHSGLTVEGPQSWESRRAEFGILAWGCDFDQSDTPATAGLVDELVSRTKGCYLGQEVVCKTTMRGAVREQVVRLWFSEVPEVGAEIISIETGESVGKVSSVGARSAEGAWAIGRLRFSAIVEDSAVTSGRATGRIRPRVPPNGC